MPSTLAVLSLMTRWMIAPFPRQRPPARVRDPQPCDLDRTSAGQHLDLTPLATTSTPLLGGYLCIVPALLEDPERAVLLR
jgi:hypothetical protein